MKNKKKTTDSGKKISKKAPINKPFLLIDKNLVTTKEKTHNTVQQPTQTKQPQPIVTPKKPLNQVFCREKLRECNISPFSSSGKSSISPRCRKSCSPAVKQDKQQRQPRQRPLIQPAKIKQKKRFQPQKRQLKVKQKTVKEQCNLTYQNFVISKLNEKKISQINQEVEVPKTKFNENTTNRLPQKHKDCIQRRKKYFKLRQLKFKIYEKYKRELSSLKTQELNFFCAIVFIQRLWRQRKIKDFISEYLHPKPKSEESRLSVVNRKSSPKLVEVNEQQTFQFIRKYHPLNFSKNKGIPKREQQCPMTIQNKKNKKVNMKLNYFQLKADFPQKKEEKFIKFVESYRDIIFVKASRPYNKNRINVFNLEESLSQKCLMQSFYSQIFNDTTAAEKFNNFTLKKHQKQLQISIQSIKTIENSPKLDLIQNQEQLQANLYTNDAKFDLQKIKTVEIGVDTQELQSKDQKPIRSLKQINLVSEKLFLSLLIQFAEQLLTFVNKSRLFERENNKLPGLKVTSHTIRQYLTGLIDYMMKNYESEVLRRFSLISPLSFLKIYRQYEEQGQDEDQINMPIMPVTIFYEYQLLYESQVFIIEESDKKYGNFLQSLIKIHNLLLSNCLSQSLEKSRIDKVRLPWDNDFIANWHKKAQTSKKKLEKELGEIVVSICQRAFVKLGQYHLRIDDVAQEQKLSRNISQQYRLQGKEWSAQYQLLELRMDLSKYVQQLMIGQMMQEIVMFF